MSRQNKTANQYTVCILGLSCQRKRMGLWTVAWWSQTRHHCIRHHPGPWTSNRRFIGHSFCPTSKGEGDSHNDTAEQYMQTEGGLCQLLHPLSGTDKSWSETSYKMLFQFSPGVVQLVAGSATATVTTYPELPPLSSSHFVARSGSLVLWQLQHMQKGDKGTSRHVHYHPFITQ